MNADYTEEDLAQIELMRLPWYVRWAIGFGLVDRPGAK